MHRLLHPLFVLAVAALLVNDRMLKAAVPGVMTGKLSDFAGLIVLPVLLCAAFSVATRRSAWVIHGAVGAVFAAMQFVPVGPWLDALRHAMGFPFHHTSDPTDLVALVVLPLGVHIATHARRSERRPVLVSAVASVALLAVLGTTVPEGKRLVHNAPLAQADTFEDAVANAERRWRHAGLQQIRGLGATAIPTDDPMPPGLAVGAYSSAGGAGSRVVLREPVLPANTLVIWLEVWTQWDKPRLSVNLYDVTDLYERRQSPGVNRRVVPDDTLRAIIQRRLLNPLKVKEAP